jgi:PAS domain S-box-containing protein
MMADEVWEDGLDEATRLAVLDLLVSEAPIGIAVIDRQLRYLAVNEFLADTNGVAPEAHLGRTVEEVLGTSGTHLAELLRGVVERNDRVSLDLEIETPAAPGILRRFTAQFAPLVLGGRTDVVLATVLEHTDTGAAVEVLRASERRYRSLVEATTSLVWTITPGERDHRDWLEAIHPDDRQRIEEAWMSCLADPRVFEEECRVQARHGTRYVVVRAVPIVEGGEVREWVGASTDITSTRLAEQALRASEAQLRLAVESGGMGTYDWDLATDTISWSGETAAIFGTTLEEFGGTWESFAALVHPDDLREIEAKIAGMGPGDGTFEAEMRVRRDGTWSGRVLSKGQLLSDGSGRGRRLIGMVVDLTERQRQAERVSQLLEGLGDAFFAIDTEWRFSYLNAEAVRLLQRPAEDLLGRSIWETFPAATGSPFELAYREAMVERRIVDFEANYPGLGWFGIRAFPSHDGISVYFRNIDTERSAVEDRRRLEDQRQAAAARTARLGEVAAALTEALSQEDVARLVLVHARAAIDARGGAVAAFDPDGVELRWIAVEGYEEGARQKVWSSPLDADRPVTRVVRERAPQFLRSPEELAREFPPFADLFAAVGDESLCALPLIAGGRVLGGMTLTFSQPQPFSAEDRLVLTALADTAAQAMERARLYEREHRVAETLQRALLPERLADPPGVASAARYLPGTEGVAVGGDWYDVFDLDEHRLGIALGDVVGKGVGAAAVMGRLRNALRAYATSIDGPAEVLSRVDDFAARFGNDDLATVVYGVLDTGTGELRFSSAGHLPPLLVGSDGTATFLPQEPDVPVGVAAADGRHEHRVRLEAGATLLLYSDGLVEDRARSLDAGLAQLAAVAATQVAHAEVEPACGAVVDALVGPTGGADDVALLLLRWAGPTASDRCRVILPPEVASARRARHLLTEELERWGEAELVETAVLCVSEVVTNAVVHAGTPVALEIALRADRVRIEVADGGAAPPERVEADADAVHGRGIAIVELLSAGWGVEQRDEGKCVWFELERTNP